MEVITYKDITRSHVIRHGIYDVFIMPDPKNNPKETYDLFRNNIRFTLKQVIDYVDTFKSTADHYDIDCLYYSGIYMHTYIDQPFLYKITNNKTVTLPDPVVLVGNFVTIAYVSLDIMDKCKREPMLIKITHFLGKNVRECCLNIKYLCE